MALSTPLKIAQTTTRETVEAELTGAKRDWVGAVFKYALLGALLFALLILVVLVGAQIVEGGSVLTTRFGTS